MISIIKNLFITMHGIPMLKLNFGECHSLSSDDYLLSGFISVLDAFSSEITGSTLRSINFNNYIFHFFKEQNKDTLLCVIIADTIDDPDTINFKIKKIASLFHDIYSESIKSFSGEISRFNNFKNVLINMNLAQKNCGDRPECEGCPNSDKINPILNNYKEDKKGFLKRFKLLFKKT